MISAIGPVYRTYKSGPSTEPGGTPRSNWRIDDLVLSHWNVNRRNQNQLLANNILWHWLKGQSFGNEFFLRSHYLEQKALKWPNFPHALQSRNLLPVRWSSQIPRMTLRLTLHSLKQPSEKLYIYLKSIADLSVVCKDALADVNKDKWISVFQCS